MFNLNPLQVLKKRELKYMPVHFAKAKLGDVSFFDDDYHNWIRSKLNGRYCISTMPSIDQHGNLKTAVYVGFEDQKELTYFMLACPFLRRN